MIALQSVAFDDGDCHARSREPSGQRETLLAGADDDGIIGARPTFSFGHLPLPPYGKAWEPPTRTEVLIEPGLLRDYFPRTQ